MEAVIIIMGVVIILHVLMDVTLFVKEMMPKRKRKYKKRAKRKLYQATPSTTKTRGKYQKSKKGMSGWAKRKISTKMKAYWANMTPEKKRILVDKMQRAKKLKKTLRESGF